MDRFQHIDESDSERFRDILTAMTKDGTFSSLYHLDSPFRLHFLSFHPEKEDDCYGAAIIAPDEAVSYTLSKESVMPTLKNTMHHHDYYEFLFVLEGEVYQIIENRRHLYTAGSCCLLNKKVQHTEEYNSDFWVVFLHFSDDFIREVQKVFSLNYFKAERDHTVTDFEKFLFQNLYNDGSDTRSYLDFIPAKANPQSSKEVREIIESIATEMLYPKIGSSAVCMGQFCRLFRALNSAADYEITSVQIGTDQENEIFDKISSAMEQSGGRISRNELAASLNYSGVYLNKIVKKYTGLSIYDYGMTFCMKKAAGLLLSSSMSISEIAVLTGFTNKTQFYKVFEKTYHMLPAAYRSEHQQPQMH